MSREAIGKIALGSAQFGMDYGITNSRGRIKQEKINELLGLAHRSGIRTIDTAQTYGCSENAIGDYLSKNPNEHWKIVTKVSADFENLREALAGSYDRLTIPPYALLAHSAELFLEHDFQNQILALRSEGLVQAVGVSLYTEIEIEQVLGAAYCPELIQLPINILDTRLYHGGSLKKIYERGVDIHARSVFLQGLFYLPESEVERRFPEAYSTIEKLRLIAHEVDLELSELSLLWLLGIQEISSVIIGVDSPAHLSRHLETLTKGVDSQVFEAALAIRFTNPKILNPSLWR